MNSAMHSGEASRDTLPDTAPEAPHGSRATLHRVVSGAAMDTVVAAPRGRRRWIAAAIAAALVVAGAAVWHWMPRGLQVDASEVRLATVERGVFDDAIVVRASVVPQESVILDAVASGRVEEVRVQDGALVHRGDLLFRLSNPQSQLELLARQSDHATQISNLSNLRLELEASRADYDRRTRDADFALTQARKAEQRAGELAHQGFVSPVALDDATVEVRKQERTLREEHASAESSLRVQRTAIEQMERAIASLESGLTLVQASVDALAVRASADGRLTDFHLQVGEIVKPDQHIGRIDDPQRVKLTAQIDEFYRDRVVAGQHASAQINGRASALTVSRIDPQIAQGRFTVEMAFAGADAPALEPGRSVDIQLALGTPGAALLLPVAPYLNDSGGAWVWALEPDGRAALKRPIRTGRRSSSQLEVLSGLVPGQRVIVSSYAGFGNAQRLQISP